jgi:hypothetical protein
MTEKTKEIERMFSFYGFISCPLSKKRIVSLIMRGKTKNDIYSIGCDVYCGALYVSK